MQALATRGMQKNIQQLPVSYTPTEVAYAPIQNYFLSCTYITNPRSLKMKIVSGLEKNYLSFGLPETLTL